MSFTLLRHCSVNLCRYVCILNPKEINSEMNTYIIFMKHAFYVSTICISKVKELYYYINGLLVIKYSWGKLIGKEVSALCVSTTAYY